MVIHVMREVAFIEAREITRPPMSSTCSTSSPSTNTKKRKKENLIEREDPKSDSSDESESGTSDESESEDEKELDDAAPILSHAERRRRAKRTAKALVESPSKRRKLSSSDENLHSIDDSPGQTKRQNSIWVGNLAFKTSTEDIRRFFSQCGGEITRVHMPMRAGIPGQKGIMPAVKRAENRGFAYVDFSTPEAKAAAIALSEKPLTGRRLLIKDGDDFAGRPTATPTDSTTAPSTPHTGLTKTAQKILRSQKQPPAPTLFFGNLGFEITEESIKSMLEAHSKKEKGKDVTKGGENVGEEEGGGSGRGKERGVWIRKVRMGTFEDSGLCKGFAFVDFMTIEGATSALINPRNHFMDGRALVVEYASPDAVRRGAPKSNKDKDLMKGDRVGSKRKRDYVSKRCGPRQMKVRERRMKALEEGEGRADEGTIRKVVMKGEAEARRGEPGAGGRGGDQGTERPRLDRKGKPRPKPGAALALAKRESAAIVASVGTKIVF